MVDLNLPDSYRRRLHEGEEGRLFFLEAAATILAKCTDSLNRLNAGALTANIELAQAHLALADRVPPVQDTVPEPAPEDVVPHQFAPATTYVQIPPGYLMELRDLVSGCTPLDGADRRQLVGALADWLRSLPRAEVR